MMTNLTNLMTNRKPRLLILSGQLGQGHVQAARAVKEMAAIACPEADVHIVDFMEWNHPYSHPFSRYLFVQSVKNFPYIWGYLYRKTRYDNAFTQLCKKFRTYALKRMMKLLDEVQPTVVVSTFPPAAAAMSLLKSRGWARLPLVTIITDHTDHSYWIHPYTDHYLVGSPAVKQALGRLHIPERCITVTGIPVRPQFCCEYDRSALAARHRLDPARKTVLIMGGGCGLIGGELSGMINARELFAEPLQFIIVCGRNQKVYDRFAEELKDSPHRIVLTGFVEHIHEFMAISDLIVTKPGGLTSSEAVAMSIPMLLYKPLPGQEQDNAAVLTEAGVAVEAGSEHELRQRLMQMLSSPPQLLQMRANARAFRIRHASGPDELLHAILHTSGRQPFEPAVTAAAGRWTDRVV